MAVAGLSSTFSFTKRTSSRSSLISSRIGEMRRHGTHHGAQKSTMTGFSAPKTSFSNVASVTSATAISTSKGTINLLRLRQSTTPPTAVGPARHRTCTRVKKRGLGLGLPYALLAVRARRGFVFLLLPLAVAENRRLTGVSDEELRPDLFGQLLGAARLEDAGTQGFGVRGGAAGGQSHGLDR